jgi:hypothetical protein
MLQLPLIIRHILLDDKNLYDYSFLASNDFAEIVSIEINYSK